MVFADPYKPLQHSAVSPKSSTLTRDTSFAAETSSVVCSVNFDLSDLGSYLILNRCGSRDGSSGAGTNLIVGHMSGA